MKRAMTRVGWFALAGLLVAGPVARAQDDDDGPDEGIAQFQANESDDAEPPMPVAPEEIAQSPGAQVSYDDFYADLAPYGEWFDLPGYGRVFRPYASVVGDDFRPYATGGQWVYTPYGWSFVSDLPFAWATFHYGRWALDVTYGWIWVPGTVWGPAWVDWRWGGGYVGWAPLPPAGWAATWYDPYWSFVQVNVFGSPDVDVYVLPHRRVRHVYEETRPVGGRIRYRGTAYCPGPSPVRVARVTHTFIRPVPVATGRVRPVPIFPHGRQSWPAAPIRVRPGPVPRPTRPPVMRDRAYPVQPQPARPSPEFRRPPQEQRFQPQPARPSPEFRRPPQEQRFQPAFAPRYSPPPRRNAPAPRFGSAPPRVAPRPQQQRRAPPSHPAPVRREPQWREVR